MGSNKSALITTTVASRMLNIHINTVRRWGDQGILKSYRVGPRRDRRFMREDVIGVLKTDDYGFKP